MDESNKDPFAPQEANPFQGGNVLNLDTSVSGPGLKVQPQGPTLDMGGNVVSKKTLANVSRNSNGGFNLYELQSASQIDPFTGRAFNKTDSNKMYDGVNRGHLTGIKEIEFLHGKGEKDPTARDMMANGFTPTTENDWEDMRAQKQGSWTKFAYGMGNMGVTAFTTGVESLFGAPTGLASLGIAGLNAETQRATESYISGENKTKTMLDGEQAAPGALSGLMGFLDMFGAEPHKIVTGSDGKEYYVDESAMTDNQFQEGETGPYLIEKTSDEKTLESNLRSTIETDATLMRALREKNMSVDDAIMAIKEEKAQRSGGYQAGLALKQAFGGTIGYNSVGGIGSQSNLKKYKDVVSKTIQSKSGPEAWQDIAAAYWDTDLGNALDEMRESASNAMPFYYTRKEQESDEINWIPFEEGSANFYFDKVFNGIGFAVGAMAPLYLTRGESISATVYRGSRNLIKRAVGKVNPKSGVVSEALGAEAAAATRTVGGTPGSAGTVQSVENLATGAVNPFKNRMVKAGKMLVSSYAASYAEASVESRDVKKQYIEARLQEWEQANPGKSRNLVPADEMAEIERYANAAGNTNFAINMPILLGTNMFTISMLMGSKILGRFNVPVAGIGQEVTTASRIAGAAGSATEATWFTSKAGKIAEKTIRGAGKLGKGAIFEGGQELAQYGAQQFNLSYWSQRQTDDTASIAEHFAEAFKKTFTEQEGLEQGLIGAMIGGGMSAVSSRGESKAKKQATEKILAIRNSGVLSKITQRAEMASETKVMMEDYHKATKKGQHSKASEILARAIANEAQIAEQFGGSEMYNEMLNDMEQMSPEEFVKFALPHLGEKEGKVFTEQHVKDTVKEVRDSLKRNIETAKNIKEMVPIQQRSNPLERMTMSETQRNQEDLQIRVTEAYRNMLYSAAVVMDHHSTKIDTFAQQVNDKLEAAGLPKIDLNTLKFSIKTGVVTPDADGKVTNESVQEALSRTVSKETAEHLNLVLRALDPQDREEINNAFSGMFESAAARESAVTAYEELRKNPDKRALYYEALQADQTENNKTRRDQVAKDLITHAQTAEQLINALPNITDEEIKASALKTIKELKKKQSEIRKDKFSNLTLEEMRNLDYDSMSPIMQAAYNDALKYKKNSQLREGITNRVNDLLQQVDSKPYDLSALFKMINREKQGDKILAALAQEVQVMIAAEIKEPVTVDGMALFYDKASKKLFLISNYSLVSDPSVIDQYERTVEDFPALAKFENRFKEIMADDSSARKTAQANTTETEVDDLGQRILEEERRLADPTVVESHKLVTNVDTETIEIEGIKHQAPTGRGFLIGGRRYENTGVTIMDAVNFDPNGEVSSITLFDVEKQEYYTFRKRRGADEVETINAVYYNILLAAAFRKDTSSAPTMTDEETQAVQEDRDETLEYIIDSVVKQEYALPIDALANEVIKKQMLELNSNIRVLNKLLDSYYADYDALGYGLKEANDDPNVKKVKSMIANMQRMHNARRATLVDRGQKVQLEVGILGDQMQVLQLEADILEEDNEKLQKVVNDNQELLNSGLLDPNTVEGAKEIATLQNEIAQARQVIAFNERKIQFKTNKINSYQDEIDILMGRRTVSAEGTTEVAEGQIAEEQSQRTGETSQDTGLDELGTEPGEIEARLAEEQAAADEMASNIHSDQAGGQLDVIDPVTGELQTVDLEPAAGTGNTVSVQLDIQLTKGEYEVDDNWKVLASANESGISVGLPNDMLRDSRVVVNDKGQQTDTITIDKKALGNPNTAKPGTTVVFEVREDVKWWQNEGKSSLPEDRHWEQVPIFVKIVEEKPNALGEIVQVETYVGMLSGFKQDSKDGYKGYTRQIIYDTVKNGGKATSTIKAKRLATGARGNIINLRTSTGQVVFVNPASENGLGTRFINGVATSSTPIVAIATGVESKDAEGNVTSISRRWDVGNTQGLFPDELAKISYALEQAMLNYDTLTDAGVVAFLVQDPNGNYRVVQGSTRVLTQEAQEAAIASLKKGDVNTFNQIVGTNKIKASTPGYMYVEEVSKNWGAVEGKNGIRVTFWSPLAKSLISVQYDKLISAIEAYKRTGNADLAFSFTAVEQTEEGGKDFKSYSRDKADFEKLKPVMVKEFLDQLAQKRFQVSKALLETNQAYVSPIDPNRTYNSYTDYLFSENEAQENRKEGVGSKAILASDVANNGYGSVFFDIGLEFGSIESNGVTLPVKEEMKAKTFDQPTSTPTPAATTVTADINLGLPSLPGMPGAPTATDTFVPLVVPMDTETPTATTDAKADIERRRSEDRNSPVRESVMYKLQNKIAGVENPKPGTEVNNLATAIILAGDKLSTSIKIREGEITNVVFDQGESNFRFTYKGQKFAAFYVANARGQLRWEIAKFNEKSGTYQSISLDELKNINEKYGSQKDLLLSLGVTDLVEDIENFEKVEYSKEDKSSGNGIIPLENTVSAEQVRLGKKYGVTYTLEDFLKEYDAELAALESKPAAVPATQPAPAATTTNSAITPTKVSAADNIKEYERLNSSTDPREKTRVSYINAAAYYIAKAELESEAAKTTKIRLFGKTKIEVSEEAIKERAKEVVKRMLSNVVAPLNTDPVLYNVYDILGGYSQKYGNTSENASYDDRYYWGTGRDVYYHYVGYSQEGQRTLVVVVPNTDTSNVTRPGTVVSMSFILPNNVSAEKVAEVVMAKAKEVHAKARTNNTTVTSKTMIDNVLPVVKEAFTGKAQAAPQQAPAPTTTTTTSVSTSESVREQFIAQQAAKKAAEEKANAEMVEQEVWKKHTVAKGETLKNLAGKYKTTVADIKKWNNLKSNFIKPGQTLKIKFKVKKAVTPQTETQATTKPAPIAPKGTADELQRQAKLAQAIQEAIATTPEGISPIAVFVDKTLIEFADAQKELAALNAKLNPPAATVGENMTMEELEAFLETSVGSDPNKLQEDDVSLPTVTINGIEYLHSEVNVKFLTSLGLSMEEANEILKNIC